MFLRIFLPSSGLAQLSAPGWGRDLCGDVNRARPGKSTGVRLLGLRLEVTPRAQTCQLKAREMKEESSCKQSCKMKAKPSPVLRPPEWEDSRCSLLQRDLVITETWEPPGLCQLCPPLLAGFDKSQFHIYPTQGPGDRLITLDLGHRSHPRLVQKLHTWSSLAQETPNPLFYVVLLPARARELWTL